MRIEQCETNAATIAHRMLIRCQTFTIQLGTNWKMVYLKHPKYGTWLSSCPLMMHLSTVAQMACSQCMHTTRTKDIWQFRSAVNKWSTKCISAFAVYSRRFNKILGSFRVAGWLHSFHFWKWQITNSCSYFMHAWRWVHVCGKCVKWISKPSIIHGERTAKFKPMSSKFRENFS